MPPNPSATDSFTTSKKVESDWLDLNLPEVKPGEEPLPHREPSFEAIMSHAHMLLPWWRQTPPIPKNSEPFRMEADFPKSSG